MESTSIPPDIQLEVAPIRELLIRNGIDWDRIPWKELQFAADLWRLTRRSEGTVSADWQANGEQFMLYYARHHWDTPDKLIKLTETHAAGALTDAQRNAMTYEQYTDWERAQT